MFITVGVQLVFGPSHKQVNLASVSDIVLELMEFIQFRPEEIQEKIDRNFVVVVCRNEMTAMLFEEL